MRTGRARSRRGTLLVLGFLAGAVAVPVFHQGMLALLHAVGLTARGPYGLQPTVPFGVPQLWSLTFWGGLWGAWLAGVLGRPRRGLRYWALAVAFGACLPTLAAWFIASPLKGQAVAAGWVPSAMLTGVLVNGAWGFGTAAVLRLLWRPAREGCV
jgi:hypothetical protein